MRERLQQTQAVGFLSRGLLALDHRLVEFTCGCGRKTDRIFVGPDEHGWALAVGHQWSLGTSSPWQSVGTSWQWVPVAPVGATRHEWAVGNKGELQAPVSTRQHQQASLGTTKHYAPLAGRGHLLAVGTTGHQASTGTVILSGTRHCASLGNMGHQAVGITG